MVPFKAKKRIDKLDFIKMKKFCPLKETVKRIEKQCTVWQKMPVAHFPGPGLVFRADKEIATLVTGEQTAQGTVGSRFEETSPKTISMWQASL